MTSSNRAEVQVTRGTSVQVTRCTSVQVALCVSLILIAEDFSCLVLFFICSPSPLTSVAEAPTSLTQFSVRNFLSLSCVVIAVFSLSFGPFIAMVTLIIGKIGLPPVQLTNRHVVCMFMCRVSLVRWSLGYSHSRGGCATPTGHLISGQYTMWLTKPWLQ